MEPIDGTLLMVHCGSVHFYRKLANVYPVESDKMLMFCMEMCTLVLNVLLNITFLRLICSVFSVIDRLMKMLYV